MRKRAWLIPAEVVLLAVGALAAGDAPLAPQSQPAGNLDYWLRRAQPASQAASRPATRPGATQPRAPARRSDALPGVIELSDGTQLAGYVYTTREMPWKVWVEKEKRWRLVPPIVVLSLTAVVVGERMDLEWRWKEMGAPEKIYTGRKYPWRRFEWKLHLIDDSYVTGLIKGQPIWVRTREKTVGPMVLYERQKGPVGTTLENLVYVKRVIVSRKMMQKVQAAAAEKAVAAPS